MYLFPCALLDCGLLGSITLAYKKKKGRDRIDYFINYRDLNVYTVEK
jgi:hypothetical protein